MDYILEKLLFANIKGSYIIKKIWPSLNIFLFSLVFRLCETIVPPPIMTQSKKIFYKALIFNHI